MDMNDKPDTTQPEPTGTDVLLNLESMIKQTISTLELNRQELRKRKEMLNDMFVNDSTYQEQDKAAKEAAKIRNKTKSELMKQPAAADINQKCRELSTEVKELQLGMSDYLREYMRMSGQSEIEGDDGEVREIVQTARLVKKAKKFK